RRWLRKRNPRVQLYSMLHQSLKLADEPNPQDVWESMSKLWFRIMPIVAVILKHVGCGGSACWDIVPKRFGGNQGKDTVLIHLHVLVEPYISATLDLAQPHPRVVQAWADTAGHHLKRVVVRPVSHSPRDLMDTLLYVHGLPILAGARTSKMIAPYVPR